MLRPHHFVNDWPKDILEQQICGVSEHDMDDHRVTEVDEEDDPPSPTTPHGEPASATGSLEAVIEHEANPLKRFFKLLGPGLITGAADDDPSGIGTYATAGAALGFATLWTAIVTLPLMAVVQYICAKIGMVSGRGLAGVLRRYYPRTVLVPVLTGSAAYAVAETFGWKYGLDTKPREAKQFYAVIAIATLLGVLINFTGINPITALFWTAVINGLIAPPLLVVIMLVANNKRVMGDRVNGRVTNLLGGTATIVMWAAALGMILTWGT
jgi:Mn2+/Fe2+ NRAMP family transporter